MREQDLPKFRTVMASLAEVFSKQLSPPLIDLYWEAFRASFIEQVCEAARYWIRHGKHFPKPAEILEIIRDTALAPAKVTAPRPEYPRWLGRVNGMFLKYLARRRSTELFRGDINIAGRRAACLDLVALFERAEAEGDDMATLEHFQEQFDNAMARIPDLSEKPDWLQAELERQRKENPERDRRQ